jgi:putative oxidoreductase
MIDKIGTLIGAVVRRLAALEWLAKLFVRLSVGIMFAGSGFKKLTHIDTLIEYFARLGIPAPRLQAPFVASMELLCGSLLVIGLATRGAAAVIVILMTVATFSARLKEAHVTSLLDFLYLNEWLLLVTAVWLVFAGAGKASLDHAIARRFGFDTTKG